ncbi:hypothetical protein AAMO2058_001325500 [Amorphochlora amoebiformis]
MEKVSLVSNTPKYLDTLRDYSSAGYERGGKEGQFVRHCKGWSCYKSKSHIVIAENSRRNNNSMLKQTPFEEQEYQSRSSTRKFIVRRPLPPKPKPPADNSKDSSEKIGIGLNRAEAQQIHNLLSSAIHSDNTKVLAEAISIARAWEYKPKEEIRLAAVAFENLERKLRMTIVDNKNNMTDKPIRMLEKKSVAITPMLCAEQICLCFDSNGDRLLDFKDFLRFSRAAKLTIRHKTPKEQRKAYIFMCLRVGAEIDPAHLDSFRGISAEQLHDIAPAELLENTFNLMVPSAMYSRRRSPTSPTASAFDMRQKHDSATSKDDLSALQEPIWVNESRGDHLRIGFFAVALDALGKRFPAFFLIIKQSGGYLATTEVCEGDFDPLWEPFVISDFETESGDLEVELYAQTEGRTNKLIGAANITLRRISEMSNMSMDNMQKQRFWLGMNNAGRRPSMRTAKYGQEEKRAYIGISHIAASNTLIKNMGGPGFSFAEMMMEGKEPTMSFIQMMKS